MKTHRIVNVPLLGILSLGAVVCAGAVYGLHEFQVRRNSHVLLQQAKLAKEKGDWNAAIGHLERYLRLTPGRDADPVADLGLMQADLGLKPGGAGRLRQAYSNLESALRLDPARRDVRKQLVKTALGMGQIQDARHHLNVLLKDAPEDHELISQMSAIQEVSREYDAAVQSLEQAILLAPSEISYPSNLARLLRLRLKEPERAFAVLDSMVDRNPTNAKSYLARGEQRLQHRAIVAQESALKPENPPSTTEVEASAAALTEANLLSGAIADSQRASELDPSDESVVVFDVYCLLANNQPAEAAKKAELALQNHTKNPILYLILVEIEARAGHASEAIAWCRRGLEKLPSNSDLLWQLCSLNIDIGNIKEDDIKEDESSNTTEFKELKKNLKKYRYPSSRLAFLDARALHRLGLWQRASQKLEEVRGSLIEYPDLAKQADMLLGDCYQQLGRVDQQLTAFRRAINLDSSWIPARLGVAGALLATGKLDEAVDEYQRIAESPGAPSFALTQLVRLWLLRNLSLKPSEQRWDVPTNLLNRLASIEPENSAIPVLSAEISYLQGQSDKAEQLLMSACEASPKTFAYWEALINLAERQNAPGKAEERIEAAKNAAGDSPQLRLLQARHIAQWTKTKALDSIHQASMGVDDFDSAQRVALFNGLASLLLSLGEYDETARLAEKIVKEQPSNLQVRRLQFDLAVRSGRIDDVNKALAHVQEIEGSGPLWNYGKAVELCLRAEKESKPNLYEEAKEHLSTARLVRPNWSRLYTLMARISEAQGNEDSAIKNYVQAIDMGERDPAMGRRAVELLYQRRRYADADNLIRKLQEREVAISGEMAQLATEISLRLNDRERALQLVQGATSQLRDAKDFIWAGRALSALGKNDEAEEKFLEAVNRDQSSPEAWVALIQHYGRTLQAKKAESAIRDAEKFMKSEGATAAIGQAYESVGNLKEAQAQFEAALLASPKDLPTIRRTADYYMRHQAFQKAEPLLKRVVDMGTNASNDDHVWARRNLAMTIGANGSPAALKEAINLIEENLAVDATSEPDRQAKALILMRMPNSTSKTEAAALMEEILRDHPSSTDPAVARSRMTLAQLYFSMGDLTNADIQLRKLLVDRGDDPGYLTYFIRFLLHSKKVGEAEVLLERLAKIAPFNANTLDLTVEIAFIKDRHQDILPSIEAYLSAPQESDVEGQDRVRTAALVLERYATRLQRTGHESQSPEGPLSERLLKRADGLMRSNSGQGSKDSFALAMFLARTGRPTESLDIVQKLIATARPEDVLTTIGAIISSPGVKPEHFDRAAEILNSAISERGRLPILLNALAHVSTYRENYDEAEMLYRAVLMMDQRDVGTMNNLAILLALRGRGGNEPLALMQKAIETTGPNAVLLDSRATVHFMRKDYQHAEEDIAQSISIRPQAASYFRQALIEQKLSNRALAEAAWLKAKDLGLQVQELHPLERPLYHQLQQELQ